MKELCNSVIMIIDYVDNCATFVCFCNDHTFVATKDMRRVSNPTNLFT